MYTDVIDIGSKNADPILVITHFIQNIFLLAIITFVFFRYLLNINRYNKSTTIYMDIITTHVGYEYKMSIICFHLLYLLIIAMSKTPHIQYLCGFARHGNLINHFKFIVTISSKWYN